MSVIQKFQKSSKPHSDFRFVTHLSPLYEPHLHRN